MSKKLIILAVLLFLLSSCDRDNQNSGMMMGGGGMMGNGGMMGHVVIRGDRPPTETKGQSIQGYQQAKLTCSQCHAMPHANLHTRSEWPNVIARMTNHIKTYAKTMPSESELKSIINYYVGNAE